MHTKKYFEEIQTIANLIDINLIDKLVKELSYLRNCGGRLFFLGVGGSAGNCSHAVNDFRKLCNIEAYSPTDNVSELTARINDDGWDGVFASWLKVSRLCPNDAIFIMSVGGGSIEKTVSVNLVKAIDYANDLGAKVFGIVGRDGGYTKQKGDVIVSVPTINEKFVTPYTEAFQGVIWHCIVSHPDLQIHGTKW
jgi:D-sedoheptulose 7-phosphate isomerase